MIYVRSWCAYVCVCMNLCVVNVCMIYVLICSYVYVLSVYELHDSVLCQCVSVSVCLCVTGCELPKPVYVFICLHLCVEYVIYVTVWCVYVSVCVECVLFT